MDVVQSELIHKLSNLFQTNKEATLCSNFEVLEREIKVEAKPVQKLFQKLI
jgi:hypothetical protein